ncbi:MAG: glycosyltransferase family 39 protein [Flavobacteriales bacterium]|nr:glycosyltransferase family 39 protein [Flavobacteriales bacterium]
MWNVLKDRATRQPLAALTLIALVPRLVAAFFSGGYFAHDDHFLIIEAAGSWVDGFDYNYWLPWNQGENPRPSGHSYVYVGLHFLVFSALKALGMSDPKSMMVVVRLLHALWSLVVVRTGYRIALRLSDPAIAWHTGLFLALFYFMPFLAVRNLVEVACIPFLMLGAWQLVKRDQAPGLREVLLAGIWIGLAINIRFQTIFFAAGPGLALLLQRRLWPAVVYGLGLALPLLVLQGGIDQFLWGRPFAELGEYVLYNLNNTTTYGQLPWYNYLLLLLGIYIPFFSVAVVFGYFRRTSPLLLWLPVLLFLAIHSYFPNKQERFLFPIIPLFFVLGHVAWEQWRTTSRWWQARPKLWRGLLGFTWAINSVVLVVLVFSSSKQSRVDAMYLLRDAGDVRGLVIEDTHEQDPPMPPLFYLGKWDVLQIPYTDTTVALGPLVESAGARKPDIVLFFGVEDLDRRMAHVAEQVGPLQEIGRAKPGLVDRIVHWLNPVNRNETIVLTRIQEPPVPRP